MGYLSALIDFNGEVDGNYGIIHGCQEVASAFDLEIKDGNCIVDIHSNKDQSPIFKYKEYHKFCIENMLIPAIQPDFDTKYLAAIFDWFGSFKILKVEDRYYPQVVFRSKEISHFLCKSLGKPLKDSFIIHSKEILYFVENTKDYMLKRTEEAQIVIDCAVDSKNPYNKERMFLLKKYLKEDL